MSTARSVVPSFETLLQIMRFEQPWTMTYEDEATLQAFDVAIARAVAEMRTLTELSLPLIRIGGHLVAAKGPDPQVLLPCRKQERK